MSFNRCEFIGHLCRGWESKTTPQGRSLATNTIALNRVWKDANGVKQEAADFLDVVAWDGRGETLARFAAKGAQIHLSCRAQHQKWTDAQSGQARSRIVFVIEGFTFLGSKDGGTPSPDPEPPAAPANPGPAGGSQFPASAPFGDGDGDPTIPF